MFQPGWFGKYYLYERLAVGGMAEIFKAKMYGVDGFEKNMVVKQILPQYAGNKEFVQMFVDEAKICVNLSHGNIVPVYELGQVDGVYFISMECVDGITLGELLDAGLDANKPLSAPHSLHIACEILAGLDYAHRKTDEKGQSLHIVHRDVSPQNILISFEGEVKIVDFGIARAATKVHTTEIGVVKGKLGYMSPEQALGKDIDARADIFSAGIIMYELLTLERLFEGDSDFSFLERLKKSDIPTPSRVNTSLSPHLDAIVFKALEQQPSKRYQSAGEMKLALSRLLYQLPQEASSKTLSAYVKDLFAKKLLERREKQRICIPPALFQPGTESLEEPKPNLRPPPIPKGVLSRPEDLFQNNLVKADLDSGGPSTQRQAVLLDESKEIDDDFSYLKVGRKLKQIVVVISVVLAIGLALIFRDEIGMLLSTMDGVMDQSAARLAHKELGALVIQSHPSGATVYFGGRKVGMTNMRIANIDPDKEYELVLTLQGYPPWSRTIFPSDWKKEAEMVIRVHRDWASGSLD